MKQKLAALTLCLALAGCALLEPAGPPEWRDSPPDPAGPNEQAKGAPMLEGVEGPHILLEADGVGADASPTQLIELFNLVVVAWRTGGDAALLEGYSVHTGERRFSKTIEGPVYCVEDTGEVSENFRVVGENRITYLSSGDSGSEEVFALPESVSSRLYAPAGTGAPYDYARQADLLAYCLPDGVYVSDGRGENARRLMSGEEAALWFAYAGFDDLPAYTWDQVHFVAPLLMNGGKQVAATAWIEGADGGPEGRCVYVSTVDVKTGAYSNYPDPLHEASAPARRTGGNTLEARGKIGVQRISVMEEEIEELPWERRNSFQLDKRMGDDALTLRYGPVEGGSVLLTLPGWEGGCVIPGEDYGLCELFDSGGNRKLILVPYQKDG